MRIDWRQHAVGHGGFHSGHARFKGADEDFVWVFDCGSRASKELEKTVKAWTNDNQRVDWLFISHFDLDHVNGLDTLMSRSMIEAVMVPYVNDAELVLTLLEEARRGRLTRSLADLAADPARWLLARGAGRVVILNGPDGGLIDGAPAGPDPAPDGQGERKRPRFRDTLHARLQVLATPDVAGRRHDARVETAASPCEIIVDGEIFGGLRLRPYCETIASANHSALLSELEALVGATRAGTVQLGLGELAYAIAEFARNADNREALKALYKTHVGSSNRASMSLLSRPVIVLPGTIPTMNDAFSLDGMPAWMNTGDAELLKPAARDAWSTHYEEDLAAVEVLAAPHHGSDYNSDATFQGLAPEAIIAVHVRKDAKKHPGTSVRTAAGGRLHRVTGESHTAIHTTFVFP